MKHILLVEDDIALGQGIAMALQIPETEITVCRGLREARLAVSGRTFILLILDINLPVGSGLTLLRERKALRPEVPVLLLTANDLEIDEVAGLESGADDYITKPFSLAVLRARVNARLRRGGTAKSGELSLRGHAVSRAALVDRVWTDGGDYVDENALTVTVRRLRAKLEDDPAAPVYLKTVYGIGYIWAVTG